MSETIDNARKECHQLLVNLKTTVEGLLATPSSNVWNTYGGLPRLYKDMEAIMNHRLQVTQGPHGSCLDYWNFVRGLRWLNPTLAPSIEQYHKMTRGSRVMRAGQAWLQQSLRDHRLSAQLLILVSNKQHLYQHYIRDEAFLCSPEFFQAMVTCLQAVEHNRAALLAEIDPALLVGRMPWQKLSAGKSISLPCVTSNSEAIMIRRTVTEDRLAPPLVSPKSKEPVAELTMSGEHASIVGSCSPDESAKEALLQVLGKSGADYDQEAESFYSSQASEHPRPSDPLMHMEISVSSFARKSNSTSNLQNIAENATATGPVKSKSSNKHYKPSPRDGTKSKRMKRSETLDVILNDDAGEMFPAKNDNLRTDKKVVNGRGTLPRSSSIEPTKPDSTTTLSSGKKVSHSRSKSDVGVATLRAGDDVNARVAPGARDYTVPGMTGRDGYFPQPAEGQSLMNYLSSQDFHTCAELDKENAHFSISEALIAAIEQMKWNQVIRPQKESDHEEGDSDEEIQQLKQRIRIRRRERLKEKAKGFPTYASDGRTDTGTNTTDSTSLSESIISTDSSEGSSSDSEEIHDTEIGQGEDASESTSSNLTSLKESGLSLSMASLYSDADLQKNNHNMEKSIERSIVPTETQPPRVSSIDLVASTNSMHSAESVAISLLKKFSEKQLPKASELAWMVSEQDAPQALLPLPDSYPISPDDNENSDIAGATMRTRIRGNLEWAPPRAQIVFNIHPTPKRKVVLTKQNFRCAGCGTKVETGYMKRYRYCEYLGKYFCPCCHTNELSHIPGRIIKKWDFSKYYVSNFARDLLARIQNDPLFNITAVNPGLYRKVRALDQIRECRIQLQQMRMFLQTCRLGQSLLQHYDACPGHWCTDLDTYTLNELVRVKKNEILPYLTGLVAKSLTHINKCPLCQAKGFICELCNNDSDILFPYELNRVKQCEDCSACYHSTCYVQGKCPRCARIEARRLAREREQPKSFSDDSDEDT